MESRKEVYSVSQINRAVKNTLEQRFGSVWLIGEISSLARPGSGHWYFNLKDQFAQVRCAMFRGANFKVNFPVRDGLQVLVYAEVNVYEQRGEYQLIVKMMEPAGEGLLRQQFEVLKAKLAAEGLFEPQFKKVLPDHFRRVGVVTSPTGAALQDILHVLNRRDPSVEVVIYPTSVQGQAATAEIVQMIELANARNEVDVLIVGRGGGSLEDLWCFNEEAVARAIFNSHIPVISAVGHETDVSISDWVADERVPTPSAAAERVSRDKQALWVQLKDASIKLSMSFDRCFNEKKRTFEHLSLRLNNQHPKKQLVQQNNMLMQLEHRLQKAIMIRVMQQKQRLSHLDMRLQGLSPKVQLEQQKHRLAQLNGDLVQAMMSLKGKKIQAFEALNQRVENNPLPYRVQRYQQLLLQYQDNISYKLAGFYQKKENKFSRLCDALHSLSPLTILSRGYSITVNEEGKALKSTDTLETGDIIKTRLASGEVVSRIEKISN